MNYETERWAARRRGLDALERKVVRLHLATGRETPERLVDGLRYAISFARLTSVRNADGVDVEVDGPLHAHALGISSLLEERLRGDGLWDAVKVLPELVERTRRARQSLLDHTPLDRESLEAEVTERVLAVASGGGGGAGYVYFGVYDALERAGLIPSLMVGTSIGGLTSLFRCRRRRYDPVPAIEAARRLSWSDVLRIGESESRYGLPATLRLYLRSALGDLFRHQSGEPLRLDDMQIPLYIVATGITVDALKHDLDYYEHYFENEVRRGIRAGVRGVAKTIGMLRDFLSRSDALVQLTLGRDAGTEAFDAVDAAGFSAAVPGVLHYDVLRPDERMRRLLDALYSQYGITRLGEGGLVSNVPAKVAWESVVGGDVGRRNAFVLALDCFAPNPRRRPAWFPFQQVVRTANVEADRQFADLYIPMDRTLSPMNLVPAVREALSAMRWGRASIEDELPFVVEMCRTLEVLPDRGT